MCGKTREPIKTDAGMIITPTQTFADCPKDLTLLFAPGGSRGTLAVMQDAKVSRLHGRPRQAGAVCDKRLHRFADPCGGGLAQGMQGDIALGID